MLGLSAQTEPSREYKLKAVFLFNFAQFVDWPAQAFPDAQSPLVIGVLGQDPFGAYLDEIVRDEKVKGRPLLVERHRQVDEVRACHILFVSRSESERLDAVLLELKGRPILTVGDTDDFAKRGGMIRFVTEKNKTRMSVNLGAAKESKLKISSRFLRSAEIVTPGKN